MLRAKAFDAKLTFEKTACWNSEAVGIHGGCEMEMFGRVGLVEIPILIAPDQKVWMDKMIKEGVALEHYNVYQRLGTPDSPSVGTTPHRPEKLEVSNSEHPMFHTITGVVDGVKCPNNTCCP